jgi:two-component system uhpT operon response regulator UhpA
MTNLTRAETQVCELVLLGLGSKEIGMRLDRSPRTVEDQRYSVFKKFGVKNAVELVRKVYRIGELEGAE